MRQRTARQPAGVDRKHVDEIGRFFGDDQESAVRTELDLGRIGHRRPAEAASRPGQGVQLAPVADLESGDAARARRVEHVH